MNTADQPSQVPMIMLPGLVDPADEDEGPREHAEWVHHNGPVPTGRARTSRRGPKADAPAQRQVRRHQSR